MQLYVGSTEQFVRDTVQNQIVDKLRQAYFDYYGRRPGIPEAHSWTNSLRAMALVVDYAGLDDNGILLEYQLPLNSLRIDCMLTGHGQDDAQHATIIELKQWEACRPADGEYVVTWVGQGNREVLHPSVQSDRYRQFLQDSHSAFHEGDPIRLDSCAYLHNYSLLVEDVLLDLKYEGWLKTTPVFSKDDVDPLRDWLVERVGKGDGNPILNRVLRSPLRPSKKLMEHVGGVIRGNPQYVLLDEQLVVYDKIRTLLKKGLHRAQKHAVIVKGGPGTGKSVIAINVMADLLGQGYSTHYVTGSRAFTQTLRRIVGARGSPLFRYFFDYATVDPGIIDVLVMDEAHRIRLTSNRRYTPKTDRSSIPQVQELLKAGKVCVFFIDDQQVVKPDEIGSSAYIKEAAEAMGAVVHEHQLDVQFRCGGSEGFIQWVDNTLDIRPSATVLWEPTETFDFRLVATPADLDALIRQRQAEGHTARLVGGYCWPWSDPRPDGTLVDDIDLPGFKRPWNANPDAGRVAKGIPKAPLWAYDPRGIDQVGCVYTAQGFEFDYAGVLWGRDLRYDFDRGEWIGDKNASCDRDLKRKAGDRFTEMVKNTYRVLLTRGMKGCYVWVQDEETRRFVASRMRRRV